MGKVVIFDTEFTSWEGAQARNWSGPGEYRELIQIGAVRVDTATFDVCDTFDVLIKPQRNPLLSEFITGLTGITQQMVEVQGMLFPAALGRFLDFTGELALWAYGHDCDIVAENMQLNNLSVPAGWPACAESNLGPWFHRHAPETQGVNSGRLALTLGVPLEIAEHTGLGDSLSIAAALRELVVGRGCPSPFAN